MKSSPPSRQRSVILINGAIIRGSRSGATICSAMRNVQGCHLAGACPYEVLDISAWAEAAFQHFLHNPLAQRMPRKFKINFSGCDTDCGQAMFNDIGVIEIGRASCRERLCQYV